MADTVSDFLLRRLHEWGVRYIFGYPGDGINGIMGALGRAEKSELGLQFVQSRHEELSAFMACGYAKFTGEVGVCLATSGPGAIHLLNGLYDAKLDHQPVVASDSHLCRLRQRKRNYKKQPAFSTPEIRWPCWLAPGRCAPRTKSSRLRSAWAQA